MSDILTAPAEHALEVRHSRFLARAQPVASSEAALLPLASETEPAADIQLVPPPR